MSIGRGLSAFVDTYLAAQRGQRANDELRMRRDLAAKELAGRQQEQEDLGMLARRYQERRAATGVDPMTATQGPGGPAVMGAPPVGEPGGMPPGPPPAPGAPAQAPMVPVAQPPRRGMLEEMDPAVAGRILSRPTSRAAFKDLETAEREHEAAENRRQANTVFGEATKALKAGDTLGFYDQMAKGQRLLGHHDRAGQYLEHALNLRQDKEELEKSNADLAGWITAKNAFDADPSPEKYQAFLDSLSKADSKAGRALRQQLLSNVITKTFNQNPQITAFNKAIAGGYQEAFQAGKQPDPEAIFRGAAAANPAGFNAYLFDAMANGKKIPEVVLKKVLRWDVADPKEIPKDVYSFAFARTQAMMPGVRPDDPRFMERWNQEIVRIQKQMSTAKAAEKREDPGKELRSDLEGARRRLADVRTNLRQKDLAEQDPERYQNLLNEERQAQADLDSLEGRARKAGTLGPEVEKETPKAKASPVPPKPDDERGVKVYRNAAKMEFERLRQVGMEGTAAIAAMKQNGWDIAD